MRLCESGASTFALKESQCTHCHAFSEHHALISSIYKQWHFAVVLESRCVVLVSMQWLRGKY